MKESYTIRESVKGGLNQTLTFSDLFLDSKYKNVMPVPVGYFSSSAEENAKRCFV